MYKKVSHSIICNKENLKITGISINRMHLYNKANIFIHSYETMFMVHHAALHLACRAEERDDASSKDVIYLHRIQN